MGKHDVHKKEPDFCLAMGTEGSGFDQVIHGDSLALAGRNSVKAQRVKIDWHAELPIYACESYLKAVSDDYGWIGGTDESGKLRCILPYTIIRKPLIRMVRFRVETIPLGGELAMDEEESFLDSTVTFFRSTGADMIIPPTTNSVFRTYPRGALAAPYSTYIIDLQVDEGTLWTNISRSYRKDIRGAISKGVTIQGGIEQADIAHRLVRDTYKRSGLPFMSFKSFQRLLAGLGENAKLLVAYDQGIPQSCTAFHFSKHSAYAVHGGSIAGAVPGAMKLVQWEAMRIFRELGVRRFNLMGARVHPEKGSKQEGILLFKQHFGGKPVQGYIWKYPFHPLKYSLYRLAARLLWGGDIVDTERHKLQDFIDRDVNRGA